jgi:SNF2 family DNA or RNA helicase
MASMDKEQATQIRRLMEQGLSNFKGRLIVPYQKRGVEWMLKRELTTKCGIQGDDLGLGKTAMTLFTMVANPINKPTLIVVPNQIVAQWQSAAKTFTGRTSVYMTVEDVKRFGNGLNDFFRLDSDDIVVTTYSAFQMTCKRSAEGFLIHPFSRVAWGRIVLDEAHIIKNNKTKVHQQLCALTSVYKWCLTGTPIQKDIGDFKALLSFMGVPVWKSMNDDELRSVRNKYLIRRTKADVARANERLRLPPLHINTVTVPFATEEESDIYKSVLEYTKETMVNQNNAMEILELFLRLRQVCIHPQIYIDSMERKGAVGISSLPDFTGNGTKIDMLIESLKQQKRGEKSLIFSQFTSEIRLIQESLLNTAGIHSFTLDGSSNALGKEIVIQAWKRSTTHNVLIVQIDVGACGLNLQEGQHVYIMSPGWNPHKEMQAIGRSYRTGQVNVVKVTRFVIQNTVEEKILELQERKIELTSKTLGDPRIMHMLTSVDS